MRIVFYLTDGSSDSSDSSEESVPEGDDTDGDAAAEEPLVRCKRPICDETCEYGFKKDDTGCPTCECLEAAESSLIGRPDGHEAAPCEINSFFYNDLVFLENPIRSSCEFFHTCIFFYKTPDPDRMRLG